MKQFIALLFLFFTLLFCFKYWTETKFMQARYCVHIDSITAWKLHYSTWNGKNEYGVDKSCYVYWYNNGKHDHSEWWNVGDCLDPTPIQIRVIDYTCH